VQEAHDVGALSDAEHAAAKRRIVDLVDAATALAGRVPPRFWSRSAQFLERFGAVGRCSELL
jgi:hypothetical protein